MKKKIAIAMSGGVDSSVSALFLIQQGYDVEAVFMNNWVEDSCSLKNDINDVKNICKKIKIKLHIIEFSEEYWNNVFSKSIIMFNRGYTPNPDILCNKEIKFKVLIEYILFIGIKYVATGHYIQKLKINNIFFLKNGIDKKKDQSYFLCMVNQLSINHAIFPIGHLKKSIVRDIALFSNFMNARKKDSTGICFIEEKRFDNFLSKYIIKKIGNVFNINYKYLAKHKGIMFYTIGQRYPVILKNISLLKPWYIFKKDKKNNTIFICQGNFNLHLFKKEIIINNIYWISIFYQKKFNYYCKIRYQSNSVLCFIIFKNNKLIINFKVKQRAITAGQSIVFYKNHICLGSGIIE